MDKLIAFTNQTESRDKLLKILQYGSRFIAWILSKEDEEELEKKFRNLFSKIENLIKNSFDKRFAKSFSFIQNA